MQMTKTLQELAEHLGGVVRGDGSLKITGLAPLDNAGPGTITFLANPKYAAKVAETGADAILMAPGGESYGKMFWSWQIRIWALPGCLPCSTLTRTRLWGSCRGRYLAPMWPWAQE